MRGNPFRPLNKARAFREGFLEAELPDICGLREPVKIEMPEGQPGCLIGLDEGESGARRLLSLNQGGDDPPRERRLAGAEGAGETKDVALGEQRRKPCAERPGRLFARQEDRLVEHDAPR